MVSNKTKGIIAVAYLMAAVTFLCVGDAYDVDWYAFFYETELFLALSFTLIIYKTIKKNIYKKIFEVLILWKIFYVLFNIVILFKPFESYRDFTSDPVLCIQILWLIIGFSIVQVYRK